MTTNKWLKLTNQRTQILEFMQTTKDHPTAEEIYNILRPQIPRLSQSTIYRNLKSLELEKVINIIKTPDKKIHYEISSPDHAHFFCLRCRKLVELPLAELIDIKKRLERKDFQITKINFVIEGICNKCRKNINNERNF